MNAKEITQQVLDLGLDLAPLPPWVPKWLVKFVVAIVVATIVVLAENIDWKALFEEWAKNAAPAPPNTSPPIPVPSGGIPVPGNPNPPTEM